MDSLLDKIKKFPVAIFVLSDIFFIAVSAFAAFLLRFDGVLPAERGINLYSFFILAVAITLPVFFLRGLYKISWKYVSITDIPNIASAVLMSVLIMGAGLFFLRDNSFFIGFPRSIIFIYFILVLFFCLALRFSKRFYLQVFKSGQISFGGNKEQDFPLTSKILSDKEIKSVLITGGAGYVGSVLARKLLENNYNVKVLDKLLFGEEPIEELEKNERFQFIKGDIFDKETLLRALSDIDAVVNLAAIVGEPACLCQKDVALRTNYFGAVYVARLCKSLGIKRFIQASTCSAYGKNEEDFAAKEHSKLLPVDFYGETKIYAERELMNLADKNFSPTILRFSTLYGLSPRMRFDLVVNTLTKKAVKSKEITIFGGEQWRPLLHVQDVAEAILLVLKAPLKKVGWQIFNVGSNDENYSLSKLGWLVHEIILGTKIITIDNLADRRNYKVDFSKIEKTLGFMPKKKVKDGIIEIKEALEKNTFPDPEDKKYYNHMAAQ